ncbi:MAG: glycosyltransferase [Pseudomonadota bacterium]
MKLFLDVSPLFAATASREERRLALLLAAALLPRCQSGLYFFDGPRLLPRAFVEWTLDQAAADPDTGAHLRMESAQQVQSGQVSKALSKYESDACVGLHVAPALRARENETGAAYGFDFDIQYLVDLAPLRFPELFGGASSGGASEGDTQTALWAELGIRWLSEMALTLVPSAAMSRGIATLAATDQPVPTAIAEPAVLAPTRGAALAAWGPVATPPHLVALIEPGPLGNAELVLEALRRHSSAFARLPVRLLVSPGTRAEVPPDLGPLASVQIVRSDDACRAELCRAAAAILPRLHDPSGRWAVEAGCLGVPVIAAASGALPEMADGETTEFFDAVSPSALADAVMRQLERRLDTADRDALGERMAEADGLGRFAESVLDAVMRVVDGRVDDHLSAAAARARFEAIAERVAS